MNKTERSFGERTKHTAGRDINGGNMSYNIENHEEKYHKQSIIEQICFYFFMLLYLIFAIPLIKICFDFWENIFGTK